IRAPMQHSFDHPTRYFIVNDGAATNPCDTAFAARLPFKACHIIPTDETAATPIMMLNAILIDMQGLGARQKQHEENKAIDEHQHDRQPDILKIGKSTCHNHKVDG